MKRYANGSFCVTNIICSICVSLFFIITFFSTYVYFKYDDILYGLLYILCIFIALQRMFRVMRCYYEMKEKILCLNYITIRKRDKWNDFMAIGRKLEFSYQKKYVEISYKDIESLDYIKDKKINIAFWNKKEVAIKLKNGKYVWIVRNVFSRKQLRELVLYIKESNSKIKINSSLIDYLNLT